MREDERRFIAAISKSDISTIKEMLNKVNNIVDTVNFVSSHD